MASNPNSFWQLPISLLLVLIISNMANAAQGGPQVPCYFVFGDSLADNGNNNNLKTLAKVNYFPYGIDFPGGATGRFSNGLNVHDVIVKLLGFNNYIVPFVKARGRCILKGVNYASGAAGILDETGEQLGERIPLKQQIRNHKIIISRIRAELRNDSSTMSLLNKCIYSLQIGNNDYLNNYFVAQSYNTSRQYTLEQYTAVLIEQYSQQIKTLYNYGARKFALYGLGPIGCTPYTRSLYATSGAPCADELNVAAMEFNTGLKSLVEQLNQNLTDANFTYLNPTPNADDVAKLVANETCCRMGGGGGELCIPYSRPCRDRRQYVYWDGVHPTEAFNELLGRSAYGSLSSLEANPFNISKLAKQ